MNDYECHITIALPKDAQLWLIQGVKVRVEAIKWHFSCIHGDPQLGDKIFCYATEHYVDEEIATQMVIRVAEVLKLKGCDVVRTKVEKVVFDSRRQS